MLIRTLEPKRIAIFENAGFLGLFRCFEGENWFCGFLGGGKRFFGNSFFVGSEIDRFNLISAVYFSFGSFRLFSAPFTSFLVRTHISMISLLTAYHTRVC